jgi:uncharacterized phage-like protein YoqJ
MIEYEFIHYAVVSGSYVDELSFGQEESHPYCKELKLVLTEKLLQLCDSGIRDFFSNCEYGIPLWACEAIVNMQGFREKPPRLHIIIPHEEQAVRWPDSVHERYYNVHETADSVTMLQTQFTEDCYQEADRFMVNRSVMLLTDGGNAELINYAKSRNKHIERIKLSAYD